MGNPFKKAAKRLKKVISKNPLAGKLVGGKKGGSGDLDYRSSAASKSIVDVKKQAGAGQIEYQTEV